VPTPTLFTAPIQPPERYTVSVALDRAALPLLDEQAKLLGMNRSQLIRTALDEYLAARLAPQGS